jgi:uncharacterized repeat protein (TIGR03809 family)
MTHRIDVAGGRDIVGRWCALAERRLEYLAELFETGRWRRFYSERDFLENIQEAKAAVEIWRGLATREAALDPIAVNVSWLGRAGATLPHGDPLRGQGHRLSPRPSEVPVYSPSFDVALASEAGLVCADEAPSAPSSDEEALINTLELALNLDAIEQRYPLLRNTL